jgi:hypothetical protein
MRYITFIAAILVSLCLVGCGGGGGGVASPFAGAWSGTADIAAGQPSSVPSSITMNVNREGRITGTWSDGSGSGSVSGNVRASGDATLVVAMGDTSATGGGVTTIGQDGAWTGSLPVQGEPGAVLTFRVSRQ